MYPALTKAKRPSPHIQASDSSIADQLTESAKATETYVPELRDTHAHSLSHR